MKETDRPTICVILPTYNEEKGIGPTMMELRHVLEDPEYLVIDKDSSDRTAEIAGKMGAKVIFQEGEGKGKAIAQILRHIRTSTKYVVMIDADYTYPAKSITTMIEILDENAEIGMVTGNRFDRPFSAKEAVANPYYLGNRLLALVQRLLCRVKMRDPLTGLRVIRYEILKDWKPQSRGFDVETELNHYVAKGGYGIEEIVIHYRERLGKKKLKLRHGFAILKRMLSLSLQ